MMLAAVAGIWDIQCCRSCPGRSNLGCCDWRKRPCLQQQWPDHWYILLPWRQSNRVLPDEKWGSNIRQCVSVDRKFGGLKRRQANQSLDRVEANPAATAEFVMNYR